LSILKFKIMKMKSLFFLSLLSLFCITKNLEAQTGKTGAVRVVVAGITHGHVAWILNKAKTDVIEIVGIYEPNKAIAEKNAIKFNLSKDLFYSNLATALDKTKPEAVVAFGSIHEHLKVAEAAAPRGIHIMVEKPLASNLKEALAMQAIAKKNNVMLLTNY